MGGQAKLLAVNVVWSTESAASKRGRCLHLIAVVTVPCNRHGLLYPSNCIRHDPMYPSRCIPHNPFFFFGQHCHSVPLVGCDCHALKNGSGALQGFRTSTSWSTHRTSRTTSSSSMRPLLGTISTVPRCPLSLVRACPP